MDGLIYGLVDPRDDKIHYIGATKDLKTRMFFHEQVWRLGGKSTNYGLWIHEELYQRGFPCPKGIILERCIHEIHIAERETWWIKNAKAIGWPITNMKMTSDYDYISIPKHKILLGTRRGSRYYIPEHKAPMKGVATSKDNSFLLGL